MGHHALKMHLLGAACFFVFSTALHAGPYLSSAHGNNATYGVSRPDMATAGYSRGNCAHCHEQHASVGSAEPAPATGPQGFLVFDQTPTGQTTNFCFNCHGATGGTAYQTGGFVVNRSYSYRAGGWTADSMSSVEDAFSLGSAHNLADITSFAAGQAWNFSTASNACAVCHDPHVVQGDPVNSPNTAKPASPRGWVTTLPSQHPTTDLWGDDYTAPGPGNGERMDNYTNRYQAPYRYDATTPGNSGYEPDGSTTTDGSNLTDINTFCLDCHQNAVAVISSATISANPLTAGGFLTAIDWNNEKHGKGNADTWISVASPYTSGGGSLGYVLSCLDCHEPHGSSNYFLLRGEVNGAVLSGAVTTGPNLSILCQRCHSNGWQAIHHSANDYPYRTISCSGCHGGYPQNCGRCHFHGGITGSGGVNQAYYAPFNRRTF